MWGVDLERAPLSLHIAWFGDHLRVVVVVLLLSLDPGAKSLLASTTAELGVRLAATAVPQTYVKAASQPERIEDVRDASGS